nr:hypothetical protein CFP56_20878 [Quercus suber]
MNKDVALCHIAVGAPCTSTQELDGKGKGTESKETCRHARAVKGSGKGEFFGGKGGMAWVGNLLDMERGSNTTLRLPGAGAAGCGQLSEEFYCVVILQERMVTPEGPTWEHGGDDQATGMLLFIMITVMGGGFFQTARKGGEWAFRV